MITEVVQVEFPKESRLKFKRGDKVNYKGGTASMYHNGGFHRKEVKPKPETFVWSFLAHDGFFGYVIEHEDGFPKQWFLSTMIRDGFESIPSKELQDGLFFIYADESELELSKM